MSEANSKFDADNVRNTVLYLTTQPQDLQLTLHAGNLPPQKLACRRDRLSPILMNDVE